MNTTPTTEQLGQRIARARIAAGYPKAAAFARQVLDVDSAVLWMYEHGRREPRGEMLLRIAQTTGVTVEWLLSGEGKGPTAREVA